MAPRDQTLRTLNGVICFQFHEFLILFVLVSFKTPEIELFKGISSRLAVVPNYARTAGTPGTSATVADLTKRAPHMQPSAHPKPLLKICAPPAHVKPLLRNSAPSAQRTPPAAPRESYGNKGHVVDPVNLNVNKTGRLSSRLFCLT